MTEQLDADLQGRIDNLNSAIDSFADNTYGAYRDSGELSRQRALALDAYQGKNIEPAPKGRAQVVDWSVFETIQWILPSLMRIFAGGRNIVEFEPVGPEDEDIAEQESDVLNHLVMQKTNWFLTCLTWFQDALLTKNAYCLAEMVEKVIPEIERYEGQSAEQLTMLLEENELLSSNPRFDEENPEPQIDEFGQPILDEFGQPIMAPRVLFDVEVKRVKRKKGLKYTVLPPERCVVDEETPSFSLEEADYFEYFDDVTISELRKQGFEVEDDISDDGGDTDDSLEQTARDDIFSRDLANDSDSPDATMRRIRVRYIWIRHDFDEDGLAELQKVVRVGSEILVKDGELAIEPASRIPVACIVPFINTHRHIGTSVGDLVFDIQRIKTTLLRSGLDSLYFATNPRHVAGKKVNLDDLLVSIPGGVVQVDSDAPDVAGHVQMLQSENTFPFAHQGLEHMDRVIESRVGVNRVFQGIDEGQLNHHDRIGQLSTMAAQRVEQIARIFAFGVEELFSISHELHIKSGASMETIKLKNEWINVDPTQWKTGRDIKIVAPFAAGNKDSLLQRLLVHRGIHSEAAQSGHPMVQQDDSYQLALEIAEATDLQGTKFYTDPTTIPPPEPPPDYQAIQLEIANKEVDNRAQNDQMDAQNKEAEIAADNATKLEIARLNAEKEIVLEALRQDKALNVEEFRARLKNAPVELSNELQQRAQDSTSALREEVSALNQRLDELARQVTAERELITDDNGRPIGSRLKAVS